MLEGELVFTVEDEEIVAGPGTFVLDRPDCATRSPTGPTRSARFLNIHAPAGFDLRLEQD